MKVVTVQFALDVTSDEEAADAVNEILREHPRHFAPESCLIDYAQGNCTNVDLDPDDYEEGEAFKADTIQPTVGM